MLLIVLKWFIVPTLLLLVGYLYLGPYLFPKVAGYLLNRTPVEQLMLL
ncbi:MAG TPA: hypothetical protein VNK96_08990 [Fimbriimonadales bacterium]|nr:hypothetical protein [Fimbriimonadales bacterium]